MDSVPTLGELLDERRFTVAEAALLAGVDPSTVSRWRSGEAQPRPTSLICLAHGLGISVTLMRKIMDHTAAEAQRREQASR